jgi:hypothetical protein
MYPFTVHHVAGMMTRRVTLYTESGTQRNGWHNALKEMAEARSARQRENLVHLLPFQDPHLANR